MVDWSRMWASPIANTGRGLGVRTGKGRGRLEAFCGGVLGFGYGPQAAAGSKVEWACGLGSAANAPTRVVHGKFS